MTQQATAARPREELDGRHDFDFLFGQWRIANRKLEDPFDENSAWLEFDASHECRPILGGLGNCETVEVADLPGRGHYHGFGLRLFDPGEKVWRIWWASTVGEGRLDEPVVGRFSDGAGRFECDDTVAGRKVRVRYDFTDITDSSARWQQSFSMDGGRTFVANWICELTRVT
jgi:hypothetical protein